jgi:hypothetical protein
VAHTWPRPRSYTLLHMLHMCCIPGRGPAHIPCCICCISVAYLADAPLIYTPDKTTIQDLLSPPFSKTKKGEGGG